MGGIFNVYLEIRGYLGHSDIRKHCPFRDFIVWIGFCVMLTLIDRILGDREIAAVLILHRVFEKTVLFSKQR